MAAPGPAANRRARCCADARAADRAGPDVDRWASHGVEIGAWPATGPVTARVCALARFVPGSVLGRTRAAAGSCSSWWRDRGWVAGGDGERRPLAEGEAALWSPGEEHESGSEAGMTVCIIESAVDPTGSGQ